MVTKKKGLQLWLKTAVVTKTAVTADEFAERSNGSPAVGRKDERIIMH